MQRSQFRKVDYKLVILGRDFALAVYVGRPRRRVIDTKHVFVQLCLAPIRTVEGMERQAALYFTLEDLHYRKVPKTVK